MKVPKINGSSIKNFFFYNVEKVILGISLVLLGLLFYLGMSSDKYDKTPDKLVRRLGTQPRTSASLPTGR